MALSNSIQAYGDCKDFLEKAMESTRGARMFFKSRDQAEHWRMKCYQFRKLDRQANRLVFEPGHQMHGCSEYDVLSMTIAADTEDNWWVYARKAILDPGRVEDLDELEGPIDGDEATA